MKSIYRVRRRWGHKGKTNKKNKKNKKKEKKIWNKKGNINTILKNNIDNKGSILKINGVLNFFSAVRF